MYIQVLLTIDQGGGSESYNYGDVITLAGDNNQYIVAEDSGDYATALKINKPGLREVIANAAAITIKPAYTSNVCLSSDAIVLAIQPPATSSSQLSDAAIERAIVMDEKSSLMFELSVFKQYRQCSMEVAACWGVKTIKSQHMALLLS